ncbi:MAG: prephenate dehydrogenase [Isosphaeraceae bacterium]
MERLGTVVIVGVGLIGGSIGLALRKRGLAAEVVGVGRDRSVLEEIRRQGAIDRGTTALEDAVSRAQAVVVCTPVNRIPDDVRRAADAAGPDVLVTDAGSTKRQIVESVERHPRSASVFVGAHPLAGSERRGAVHASADLFQGRVCMLTPTHRTQPEQLRRARAFWTSLGSRLVEMNPADHDEILAHTSHLPHALAAALAASVPAEWQALAAGAFRDGTRVAAADTALWTAIFRDNRGPLLKALGHLQESLDAFKYALMTDDEDAIRQWWDNAKKRRNLFDAQHRETEPDSKPSS